MGWRNFWTRVSCFSKTLFYFILLALTHRCVTCCWHPKEFGSPFSVGGLSNEGAIVHTPCRIRITLTTNQQVPKWFCSCGRCAHRVINFCGAPLLNKPPWLLPLSSAILLGNRTTLLAVLHRARPDIIKPACHHPTCHYSIIKQTCLSCRWLISGYVLTFPSQQQKWHNRTTVLYTKYVRNTKNYFPPEPKKPTQHHNCMIL